MCYVVLVCESSALLFVFSSVVLLQLDAFVFVVCVYYDFVACNNIWFTFCDAFAITLEVCMISRVVLVWACWVVVMW